VTKVRSNRDKVVCYRVFFLCLVIGSAKASASTLEFRDGVDIVPDVANTGFIYNGTNDAELRERDPTLNFDFGIGSTTEAELRST
jgi:hypothetical protein